MLRGAARPVQLYRLIRHEQKRDPACGRTVESPAARLQQGEDEPCFCSEEGLRDYLGAARAAV
jgi:hypothetical protein